MIRKAIIAVLTLGAVGTAALWAESHWHWRALSYRESLGKATEWLTVEGHLQIYSELHLEPPLPDVGVRIWSYAGFTVIKEVSAYDPQGRWRSYVFDAPLSTNSVGFRRIVVKVPFWPVLSLFAFYPTITFIRGPMRRWRRRRCGLCLKCGYDLTGNVSGVCPECGTKVESP